MKRLIYVALAMLLATSLWARNNHHLCFRDIPITGTEAAMKDSLRARDFRWGMDGLMPGFVGYVAGQKMVVTILTTPESQEVYALLAHGPYERKWDLLKKQYSDIKDLLHQKYGRPVSHSERFHKLVLGKNSKRRAVRQGKCDYRASFKAPGGIITVFIDSDRRVCIEFQDTEGGAINEKEILSEL